MLNLLFEEYLLIIYTIAFLTINSLLLVKSSVNRLIVIYLLSEYKKKLFYILVLVPIILFFISSFANYLQILSIPQSFASQTGNTSSGIILSNNYFDLIESEEIFKLVDDTFINFLPVNLDTLNIVNLNETGDKSPKLIRTILVDFNLMENYLKQSPYIEKSFINNISFDNAEYLLSANLNASLDNKSGYLINDILIEKPKSESFVIDDSISDLFRFTGDTSLYNEQYLPGLLFIDLNKYSESTNIDLEYNGIFLNVRDRSIKSEAIFLAINEILSEKLQGYRYYSQENIVKDYFNLEEGTANSIIYLISLIISLSFVSIVLYLYSKKALDTKKLRLLLSLTTNNWGEFLILKIKYFLVLSVALISFSISFVLYNLFQLFENEEFLIFSEINTIIALLFLIGISLIILAILVLDYGTYTRNLTSREPYSILNLSIFEWIFLFISTVALNVFYFNEFYTSTFFVKESYLNILISIFYFYFYKITKHFIKISKQNREIIINSIFIILVTLVNFRYISELREILVFSEIDKLNLTHIFLVLAYIASMTSMLFIVVDLFPLSRLLIIIRASKTTFYNPSKLLFISIILISTTLFFLINWYISYQRDLTRYSQKLNLGIADQKESKLLFQSSLASSSTKQIDSSQIQYSLTTFLKAITLTQSTTGDSTEQQEVRDVYTFYVLPKLLSSDETEKNNILQAYYTNLAGQGEGNINEIKIIGEENQELSLNYISPQVLFRESGMSSEFLNLLIFSEKSIYISQETYEELGLSNTFTEKYSLITSGDVEISGTDALIESNSINNYLFNKIKNESQWVIALMIFFGYSFLLLIIFYLKFKFDFTYKKLEIFIIGRDKIFFLFGEIIYSLICVTLIAIVLTIVIN